MHKVAKGLLLYADAKDIGTDKDAIPLEKIGFLTSTSQSIDDMQEDEILKQIQIFCEANKQERHVVQIGCHGRKKKG